eukprot:7384102-Prymnesium_polylepis.1
MSSTCWSWSSMARPSCGLRRRGVLTGYGDAGAHHGTQQKTRVRRERDPTRSTQSRCRRDRLACPSCRGDRPSVGDDRAPQE